MMLHSRYVDRFPGLLPGLQGLGDTTQSAILLWPDGNCYNTVGTPSTVTDVQSAMAASNRVPCWCLVWPWADTCHPVPALPASSLAVPVAPQTQEQMTTPGAWTPDTALAWTNYVQQQVQQAQDQARATSAGTAPSSSYIPSADGAPQSTGNTALWVVGGIAAAFFLFAVVKH